ncbi:flagellar biosynthetic protein FliR [Candidatus Njordibacter sp. Uisw_039]|jgi:flagellar biosynthetic protein FliR|uniref:flagellar biosynthetic protein FliR n=1 Tax=Candidatus Njordibacter sp. Uisw_039 TaxID=3230972 RepID=UPI003A334FED
MFAVWDDVLALLYTFLWPMTRISACLLATPIFSAMSVNTTIRISLALVLTILIYPLHDWPIVDVLSGAGLVMLMEQVVIGVMMGLILQIVFAAVSAAGEFIALSMGLGFAMMVDPNSGVQTPVISQLFVILGTLVFVSIGGHLILIELLLDSFRLWPIGEPQLEMAMVWDVLQWSVLLFSGAAMIALPAMVVLLLTNSAIGVISRAAPSLNVFAVGFPLTLLMGIMVLIVLLPSFMGNVQNLWFQAFQQIRLLLGVG